MKVYKSDLDVIAARKSQYPKNKLPEFLLVGRSNVGKSSFINSVISRKNYARTSNKPGKTQTLNFYLCNDAFYLVDAPGYGYAKVDKLTKRKFGLMIEEYISERDELKRVFLVIDSRHKPTENDIIMFNYLKYFRIPITIIATKFDKLKLKNRDKSVKTIEKEFVLSDNDSLIFVSNLTKKGIVEVLRQIESEISNE